jgi:hypothetical protein
MRKGDPAKARRSAAGGPNRSNCPPWPVILLTLKQVTQNGDVGKPVLRDFNHFAMQYDYIALQNELFASFDD